MKLHAFYADKQNSGIKSSILDIKFLYLLLVRVISHSVTPRDIQRSQYFPNRYINKNGKNKKSNYFKVSLNNNTSDMHYHQGCIIKHKIQILNIFQDHHEK